jgi:uncharacterized integral membrane protein
MRFLCFLFLLAFLAAVGIFAWQNQYEVRVTWLQWGYTGSLALVVGAAYLLGMLSGWTIVGMLRRSFRRASEIIEPRRTNAPPT